MKVLVAEDSSTMRQLLVGQLRKWDYDVTEAVDGAQAWQMFQETHFPLVLTDWMMPEMDGLELMRRIRASGHSEYVYIVLLTARTEKESLVEGMEHGADDFLVKPCDPRELRVRMRAGARIIELEQKLVEQHQRLQQTQVQLIQTEKLAGVGQLAAGMAHEINNPIAYVTNNLAVLQRDIQSVMELLELYRSARDALQQADPELAAAVALLEQDCDLPWLQENLPRLFHASLGGLGRVREIILKLRDFAHLDEAELGETDFVSAVEATLEILGREVDEKQIVIQTQFDSRPSLFCQPARIKQVVYSVLLNAIQACDHGGRVDVGVSDTDEGICFRVADNGTGMDKATQKRLFEPFYTTRPVGDGQGLGLAVTYGVIRQHGGSIEFETQPGKGTVFRIRLPHKLPGAT